MFYMKYLMHVHFVRGRTDRRYIYQGMLSTVGLAPARPIKVDGSALTFGPVSPTCKVAKLLFYSEGYCTIEPPCVHFQVCCKITVF